MFDKIHKSAPVVPASVGEIKDVIATLTHTVPNGLTHIDVKCIQDNKTAFMKDIKGVFQKYLISSSMDVTLVEWQDFYRGEFGIDLDLSTLVIPERKEGFDRLLVIAESMTIQSVYSQCSQHFKTWKYTEKNLDEAIPTNDRDPKSGTYAIWVRDVVEADEQFKNKSANDLKSEQHVGITVLERLIYELKYFTETGKHLDIVNLTLCSGSRYSDGGVPYVYWYGLDSRVSVSWYYPDGRYDSLRSRQVVS